jgi:hypothetical protein
MTCLLIYGGKVDRKINTNRNVSYLVPEKNDVDKQNWQCDEARLETHSSIQTPGLSLGQYAVRITKGKCSSVVQWLREACTGFGVHNLCIVPTKCVNITYNFKELCPGVPQNSVRKAECPGLFHFIKYDISDSAYEYFDFARAGQASTGH